MYYRRMFRILKQHTLVLSAACLTISACTGSFSRIEKQSSLAVVDTERTTIGSRIKIDVDRHDGMSGFYVLSEGIEALAALRFFSARAERSLDLQYYIYHDDQTGKLLAHTLLNAADRGVRVRLLFDDIFSYGRENLLATLDAHPNIQVRLFNPVATQKLLRPFKLLTDFSRVNRRMHNKVFIADNQLAVFGGRNVGDAYFMAKEDLQYTDLDMLTVGPVVKTISSSFDTYWNSEWAVPLAAYRGNIKKAFRELAYDESRRRLAKHASALTQSSFGTALKDASIGEDLFAHKLPLLWAPSKILADPPNKVRSDTKMNPEFLEAQLKPYLDSVRSEVVIITPYFVPQWRGLQWIRALRKRGVKISVLTNSFASNDHTIAHTGYQRYRRKVLKLGVNLYEYKPDVLGEKRNLLGWLQDVPRSSMHVKAIVIDGKYVIFGSTNLSPRSRYLNTEIVAVLNSENVAKRTLALFAQLSSPQFSYKVMLVKRGWGLSWRKKTLTWSTFDQETGQYLRYLQEPATWLIPNLGVGLLSVFPLDDLL